MNKFKINKIMLINNGPIFQGTLFSKSLSKYSDTYHTGSINLSSYDYGLTGNQIFEKHIKWDDFLLNIKEYDVIIGVDHSLLPTLKQIKESYPEIKVGVQILDYPKHVFLKNKDHNKSEQNKWNQRIKDIYFMDYVFHNMENAMREFNKKKIHPNSIVSFLRYPVNTINFENYEKKDYIVYSGRVSPDKGVHYVIDALGLLEESIELRVIGTGCDLSNYAEYLNVNYKQLQCSEREKWKMYHECKFIVCGADNEYIPALCVLEGLSINKGSVVFKTKENDLHYNNSSFNIPFINIRKFADQIKKAYNNTDSLDELASGGAKFVKENCTYDVWAKKVFEIISGEK